MLNHSIVQKKTKQQTSSESNNLMDNDIDYCLTLRILEITLNFVLLFTRRMEPSAD